MRRTNMRVVTAVALLISAAGLVANVAAQSAKVTGTASERSGTPLTGVRVTVKVGNSRGAILDRAVTNDKGYYESKATLGVVWVECEAVPDSDATVYSKNPVGELLKIAATSGSAKQDCIFDRFTTADSYWKKVADRVGDKAAHSSNQNAVFQAEWLQIDASGLPPSSKAAAAQALQKAAAAQAPNKIDWSTLITFAPYSIVDLSTLKSAESGDPKALASLPAPIGNEVVAYEKAKQQRLEPKDILN
jgi:hypothetical protein